MNHPIDCDCDRCAREALAGTPWTPIGRTPVKEPVRGAVLDAALATLMGNAWPPTGSGKGGNRVRVRLEDHEAVRVAWIEWRDA